MTTNDMTAPAPFNIPVQIIDGKPRVLDTDLAVQLGLARPTNIRSDLIEPNREELEGFGILQEMPANSGQRGKPSKAFYLNRDQALLICILSKTERAKEVRAEVVHRFNAYDEPQQRASIGTDQLVSVMSAAIAQAMQTVLQAVAPKAPEPAPREAPRVVAEKPRSKAPEPAEESPVSALPNAGRQYADTIQIFWINSIRANRGWQFTA